MEKFYLTTTLPYVNAEPHMGHTLEYIQADIIVRYMRKKLGNENVFFNVGADENGSKIYNKSKEVGMSPQDFVNLYAGKLKEFCSLFNISYDNFYRTSDKSHIKVVQEFWKRSLDHDDIYKKKYEGLYCVGCESFKVEKDLVDGKCPDHGKEPVFYSEENYFFKLSKYREGLLEYINKNKDFIIPHTKTEELKNFVKDMEDISISRLKENLPWGIDVPNDPIQVVYVWFDALSNYLGAIGFPDDLNLEYANNMYQICGPDNLRFQGGIWQSMLMSAGFKNSKSVIVHGMVLGPDGIKMSKTIGNVVSPFDQLSKYGYEAIRFYIASNFGSFDSSYKEEDLVNNYNSLLADNFGNLLNRVIHLANAKEVEINNFEKVEDNFKIKVDEVFVDVGVHLENFRIMEAVKLINELATFGNVYIQENKPWEKDKKTEEIQNVLNNLSYLLFSVSDLYEAIIPESIKKAKEALKTREKIILFNKIEYKK